ncbi:retropepsin-like aspartic protease family protein [Sulfitobacter dubius]|uniref:retropepsin-like aspartic protease family protein n=1 Tax=Sulfitobacter dubius TaxID=218673 RepID=UPI0008F39142|nr:TIGR02281 family clan AA aspartic protease [Sulfitobacter dubius]SFG33211.1 aspartyl protease family protein [Sulfitobacter dubius]
MAEIDTAQLIYLIVLLTMLAGWFFLQNRPSMNKTLQQAAVWGLIFVGAAAGVGLWQDITRDTARQQLSISEAGEIVLPRGRDGHYYLTAEVNGAPVRFVVDTGASDIVLSKADAGRIGIDPEELNYLGRAATANGETRTAFVKLDEIVVGNAVDHNVSAVVNEGAMSQSLLGMGYLQRWGRIEISGGEFRLSR